MQQSMLPLALLSLLGMFSHALAFDLSKNDNLAVYWGQGANQKPLAAYCADDTIDVIPIAFLTSFTGAGNLPSLNVGNACGGTFAGTELLQCNSLAADIKTCQSKGKAMLLSLGGADTGNVAFTSDATAKAFADLIWNLFLGGSSQTRPFGDVKLDGPIRSVDLDIESGNGAHFAAFVTELRSKFTSDSSQTYYVTAAPQCPLPDAAIGAALTAAHFDAVFFNMEAWDSWAKTQSFNKDVKVYIGAPGSPSAAGSGYVDPATLAKIANNAQKQYSSMGGVMLWDAVTAYNNQRYDQAIKKAMTGSGSSAPASSSQATSSSSSQAASSTKTGSASSTKTTTADSSSTQTGSATSAPTSRGHRSRTRTNWHHRSTSSDFGHTVRVGDGPSSSGSSAASETSKASVSASSTDSASASPSPRRPARARRGR
ncbi:chitinase [Epithele typhae]|uniref:chitinase n=1 Tax=Epithele typhae TaxID=378194 RepID=UPI0020084722|nr:chitinase [Epithele typhae]KAH9910125.1 chitinase [Epithele typhae]